jgi:hypothetical protein
MQSVVWKRYSLRLRLKHETYQGQDRPKLSVRLTLHHRLYPLLSKRTR